MYSLKHSFRQKLASNLLWVGALGAGSLVGMHDAQAQAGFTLPTGLAAGSTYRLVFLTSDGIAATSSSIATYNTFVTNEAALNAALPSPNWYAIASTATTSAASNIACGGTCATDPIYLVTGTEVASSTAALLSASTTSLLSTINVFQSGATDTNSSYTWTGSSADGSGTVGNTLGSTNVSEGWSTQTDGGYLYFLTNGVNTNSLPMYAISGELTVPNAVPEPGSAPLMMSGVLLAAALGWHRHARKSA